jgi:hypothetical protein
MTRSTLRIASMKSAEATPESHVPRYGRELTPYSWFAQAGCRGVTGLVPQPLCMKSRLALWGQTGMIQLYHRVNWSASNFAANGVRRRSEGHLRELWTTGGSGHFKPGCKPASDIQVWANLSSKVLVRAPYRGFPASPGGYFAPAASAPNWSPLRFLRRWGNRQMA